MSADNGPVDLSGKGVLVTGGTRGIGHAIATAFVDAGAQVSVCGRRPPETETPGVNFVAADIRDAEQAAAAVDAVVEHAGRIDVVVNNAGGSPECLAADASPRFTAAIVNLNLVAPIYVAQRANELMRAGDGGQIINIGSLAAQQPVPGTAAYAAAKAGLATLTRALAGEWAPKVRVNQVTVGLVETEAGASHYGERLAEIGATIPMGRMARPADIAAACLLLCAPGNDYLTGAEVRVDGGGPRPAWFVN